MSHKIDVSELIGRKYNHLTIIEEAGKGRKSCTLVKCRCDCGNELIIPCYEILHNRRRTCGASEHRKISNSTHGKSNTRLYRIHHDMKRRCTDKNRNDYSHYGGRGISVCKEWESYLNFEKWAYENGYADNLTLERNDINKGYSPDNCRWIPFIEQSLNKTNTVYLNCDGIRKSLIEWSKELGIKRTILYSRKAKGYTDKEILFGKKKAASL